MTDQPRVQVSARELRARLGQAVVDAENAMANWRDLKAQLRAKHPDDPAQRIADANQLMVFTEAREDYRFALERVTLYSQALTGLAAVSTIASSTPL